MTADIPMVGRYWVPIGTSTAAFTGTFDGGGHTIGDLTMVAANASTEYGMFGNVAAGADIKNVVLRDCLFTGTNDYAGSMVYKMNGGTPIPPLTVTAGTLLPAFPEPTRTGYTFAGWVDDVGNPLA